MRRTSNFARALELGSLERTYQSGRSGVTTMWVARLGMGSEASRLARITGLSGPVTRVPEFHALIQRARIGLGIANAELVTLVALLAWRLHGKLGVVPPAELETAYCQRSPPALMAPFL